MDGMTVELFRRLEQSLLRPEVRASRKAIEALLDGDFVEFGSSGRVYDRPSVIAAMVAEVPAADRNVPEERDFAVRVLGPDIVLVTYRSVRGERSVLRSSIWRQSDGHWRLLFHQGTVA